MSKANAQLDPLLTAFLDAKRRCPAHESDGQVILDGEANACRARLVEYLLATPLAKITAQRMHARHRELMRQHIGSLDFDDLLSIAEIALVEIVDDYDPSFRKPFQTCAVARMRQKIWAEIRRKFRGGRRSLENTDQRFYEVSIDGDPDPYEDERQTWGDHLASEEESPWASLQRAEIRAAVDALPEPDRTVVRLHIFDGYSFEDVGAMLAPPIATSTACGIFQRAVATLRDWLSAYAAGLDASE